jgi:8-oxo-dGTP diphosphatase
MPNDNRPRVGLGVCVVRDGKVLLGKRKNAHGDGDWCFPGGHLEMNESWEDCAVRETAEETGIRVRNVRFATATNDIFEKEGKHYVTIIMLADYDSGEAEVKEPEKCEKWKWFTWGEDSLPRPLFTPQRNLLKQGFDPLR